MPSGHGIYGKDSDELLLKEGAELTIIGVIGGVRGNGFSISAHTKEMYEELPALLRKIADRIEAEESLGEAVVVE